MIHANYFHSHFAVQSLQFMRFSQRFVVILSSPFRHAGVRFSLTKGSHLLRFLKLFSRPHQVLFARARRSFRRFFDVYFVGQLRNAAVFQIQVFSGIRAVVTSLAVRYIAAAGVLRLGNDASVSNGRFNRNIANLSNGERRLHSALLQAAVNVRRVIAFFCLA